MPLCVFALIASEFIPVSLLMPIAADLQVSEWQPDTLSSRQASFD